MGKTRKDELPPVGSVLIHSRNDGAKVECTVTEHGFCFLNRVYPSLTAVARSAALQLGLSPSVSGCPDDERGRRDRAKGFYLVYLKSGTSGERIDVHTEEVTVAGEPGRRVFDGIAAMAITKSMFRADAERR